MPTAPFPHHYTVALAGGELLAPPRTNVATGAPPQFGGSDQVWSPEELLVGAALSCLQSTFAAHAKAAALSILGFRGTATGILVKAPGGPTFSAIEITVTLTTASADQPRAEQVLRAAERSCIISRALAVPVHLSVAFDAPALLAAG